MIVHALIATDRAAEVRLPGGIVEISGEDLPELRHRVKHSIITAAQEVDQPLDVVLVESGVRHRLRIGPKGDVSAGEIPSGPAGGTHASGPGSVHEADQEATVKLVGEWRDSAEPGERLALQPRTAARGSDAGPTAPERGAGVTPEKGPTSQETSGTRLAVRGDSTARHSAVGQDNVPEQIDDPARVRRGRPTLEHLREVTSPVDAEPPRRGWQGFLTLLTRNRVSVAPNASERAERALIDQINRVIETPKNVVVVNLKGGAHKTTTSLMLAATLGLARGEGVLAWDNNETRGTLGWRGVPAAHSRTALDLVRDLEKISGTDSTIAELDNYVRRQRPARFDILASDEDPGSAALIDAAAFEDLNRLLSRFYRIKVVDTGNNVRASNWLASVRSADQLVIVSTLREDTFNAAAWMIDELRATGLDSKVDHAVTILSHSTRRRTDPYLHKRLLQHFGSHTRAIVEVPYEEQFTAGAPLNWPRLHPRTKRAWLSAAAAVVEGL